MPSLSALYLKKIDTERRNLINYLTGPYELAEAKALYQANDKKVREATIEIGDLNRKINPVIDVIPIDTAVVLDDVKIKSRIAKYESDIRHAEQQLKEIDIKPKKANKTNNQHKQKSEDEDDSTNLEEEKDQISNKIAKLKQDKTDFETNLKKLKDAKDQFKAASDELTNLNTNCALTLDRNPNANVNRENAHAYTEKTKKIKDILEKEKDQINALKANENRKDRIKTIQDATINALKNDPIIKLEETDDLYKRIAALHKSRLQPFTDVRRSIGLKRLHELEAEKNRRKQGARNSQFNVRGANFTATAVDPQTGEEIFKPFTEDQFQKANDKLVFKQNPDIEYVENGGSKHSLTILSNDVDTLQEAVALCSTQGCNTLVLDPTENSASVAARHEIAKEALRQDYYHVTLNAEKDDKEGRMLQHIFDVKRALAKRNNDAVGLSQDTDWVELYRILGTTSVTYRGNIQRKTASSIELQEMLLENLTPAQLASLTMGLKQKHNDGKTGYDNNYYNDTINKIVSMLMKRSVREQNQYLLELKGHPDLQKALLTQLAVRHQLKLENLSPINGGDAFGADGSTNVVGTQNLHWIRRASQGKINEVMETLTAQLEPETIVHARNKLAQKPQGGNTRTYNALKALTDEIADPGNGFSPLRSGVL